jgi:DNA-directed RNA polymerase subunit RPC12/RpoP
MFDPVENCSRCGIARTHDFLDSKNVCEFCKPPIQPVYEDLQECSDCGAEFYPTESEHEFICSDCANNPYL